METYDLVAAPDRMSTILGRPCRIMQPLGTPKAKEDCEPFSFTFHDPNASGSYRTNVKGRIGTKRYGAIDNVKAQEKFTKQLAALEKKQASAAKKNLRAAA